MTDLSEASRIALALADIGRGYLSQGEFAAAETTLRQCIDANIRLLGTPHHASVAALLDMLAVAMVQQGKNEEAEAVLRECVAIKVEVLGGPAHEEAAAAIPRTGDHERVRGTRASHSVVHESVADAASQPHGMTPPRRLAAQAGHGRPCYSGDGG